jgi:hypothetical protein
VDEVIKEGVEAAVAKTLLANMSGDVVAHLLRQLWQERGDALRADALAQVQAEQQQTLVSLKEQLRDEAARERKALTTELEWELERRYRAQEQELDAEMASRIGRLKQARDTARQERDRAEQLLMALVTQLVSPQAKRYLADAGVSELDVVRLNQVVGKFGVRVRCERRETERQVKVRLKEEGPMVTRAAFWWEECAPTTEPVILDDDEEETEDTPALPPAAEGGG